MGNPPVCVPCPSVCLSQTVPLNPSSPVVGRTPSLLSITQVSVASLPVSRFKCVCVCLMLYTCTLQEGGVLTDRAPPHPVKQKTYTVGQSYYTASGRVVTMTTTDNSFAVTMDTGWLGRQVEAPPVYTTDGVMTGGRLVPIREAKTPPSGLEPPPSNGEGFHGRRGGGESLLLPRAPPGELSPTHSPAPLSGGTSPSVASVVR